MLNVTLSLKSAQKKVYCIFICIVVLLLALYVLSMCEARENAKTNEQRVAFMGSLGLEVISAPIDVQQVVIPAIFNDIYAEYNVLQRKAGFDLEDFKGETVTLLKYKLCEENTDVYMLVFENRIIGGHICGREEGSEMLPLKLSG